MRISIYSDTIDLRSRWSTLAFKGLNFGKVRRIIFMVLALCEIAGLWYLAAIQNNYLGDMALRAPDAGTARTMPYEIKGATVYITQQAATRMHWLGWFEVLAGAILILMVTIWPDLRRKKTLQEEMRLRRAKLHAGTQFQKFFQFLILATLGILWIVFMHFWEHRH